eukprot:4059405-Pleurochrysis_carterae.AAC.1
MPSCGDFKLLRTMGCIMRDCELSPINSWRAVAADWVESAMAAAAAHCRRQALEGAEDAVRLRRRQRKRRCT